MVNPSRNSSLCLLCDHDRVEAGRSSMLCCIVDVPLRAALLLHNRKMKSSGRHLSHKPPVCFYVITMDTFVLMVSICRLCSKGSLFPVIAEELSLLMEHNYKMFLRVWLVQELNKKMVRNVLRSVSKQLWLAFVNYLGIFFMPSWRCEDCLPVFSVYTVGLGY